MLLVETEAGALVMRQDAGGCWHAQAIVGMNGQRYSILLDSARWTDGSFKVDPGGLHLWDVARADDMVDAAAYAARAAAGFGIFGGPVSFTFGPIT